jgi:hypothetical protein
VLVSGDEVRWRLVTHYEIDEQSVEQVGAAFEKVLNH